MDITLVTGLWDISRSALKGGFSRNFEDHYLHHFEKLLTLDVNIYVFVPEELVSWVWERRDRHNTEVRIYSLEDIRKQFNVHWDKVQNIRTSPEWYDQTEGWLKDSPQATLEYYNPIVMSKMFMLNDVSIWNPFDSSHFFWIDAGITNTCSLDLLNNGWVDHMTDYDSLWLSYPYESNDEIHGFAREGMNKFCNTDFVDYVVRGGLFGGDRDTINYINGVYYDYLVRTLDEGYMGTEESIFTIIAHNHPEMYIHKLPDGWIGPFFERAIKDKVKNTALYVITFDAPDQFRYLLETIKQYDPKILSGTEKYVIDNSTDLSTTDRYLEVCNEYEFTHIKKDNIGITGGREFASDHFLATEHEYMIFLEDDMTFTQDNNVCRSGFRKQIPNLFSRCMKIMRKEKLDYLKLSFSEIFYDNHIQTAWFNTHEPKRTNYWGYRTKPPEVRMHHISKVRDLSYAVGEVFYCNWPHIMSRNGSKKIFEERKYLWPGEDRLMAYAYELQREGKLKAGVLLASPIQHERKFDYDRNKRKEF